MLEEEPEHADRCQPICQRGDLLVRARLPQAVRQAGYAARGDLNTATTGRFHLNAAIS